ncbi:hypothetical protein [Paenibacillus sp. UMB4589-SE434]|uniref:fibronectin type III domain-containing protein n=1 Tax=Paenibacillus sp. UMB4589-SE434 TaxID=3046314 RepID=UPI00254C3C04|nr:hypothetical protein [Paenibacillus sp. UMB4589-SE434]MDK8183922.1 hypothetical protein [Paenibacillus sp. UMB4589-SE434]
MKRILGIVMTLVLFLTVVNISPVHATPSKYTGGLLDGAVIQFGKKIGQPTGTGVTQMTDNNATTYARIELNNLAWYTFNSPQEITSVILKSEDAKYSMNFYDSNNNLLYTYNSVINDGIQTLPTPVKNVTMVVIKPSKTDFVFEWNVFKTASAPPSPTKINWIQGGDKIVTFDWNNTGAEHYTVKRSASPGGPFAILASINGTSYTDRAVTNGTTYYYVVSAGNEAGQSADSPQAIIKPSATKYTGGVLDGATLNVGASISTPTTTTRAITDNNVATYTRIETNNLAWYTFNSPKEITSVIINSEEPKSSINFYDRNNNLLYTYNSIIKDGVQTLPNPVKNVSTVVLKPSKTDLVIEWNVFTTASAPPAPTKINWIQARDKLVTFDWDLTGAKFYTVKRSTSSGGPYAVLASNITGTTYTDRAVTNGTTYYYVVSSGNEAGLSADSPQAAIKPNVTKYTGGLLDGATLNIGTSISNPRTTTRAITDNNVATYTRIETNNLAWYTFNSPKEITSVIINSEEPKSSIHFYDTNNNLLYTFNSLIKDGVQTLPNPIKNVSMVVLKPSKTDLVIEWNVFGYDQVPPTPKPSNLKATSGDTKVTLNWQLVNNASQYHIKRANKSGGPYTTISTVTGNTYSYLDASVANNTTYYYVVTANGPGGESGNSNEAYATPKQEFPPTPAPTNLIASAGDSTVTLIWQLVNDASQYHIKRGSTAGGPYTTIATVTGSTYGFVDMNLINDTTYYYVVTASGKGGESSHSNEVFATPTVGVSPASSLGQSDTQALHRYIVNNEIVRKITYQQQLSYLAHYWG